MSFHLCALIVGGLMISMAFASSLLKRLPLSPAMLYLAAGCFLGFTGVWPTISNLRDFSTILERVAEVALLISLFSVGLKIGLPLWGSQWNLPLRLGVVSMLLTVVLIAVAGVLVFDLPLGAALVLGGILAPTDPVLASDVQVDDPADRDRLRFSLTGEGGLNDGVAFSFVMLGLGFLNLHDLGQAGWRWLTVDFLWSVSGGMGIGMVLGMVIGKVVIYLRTSFNEAVGLDEFISLGLIAVAYGTAQILMASGFLAVFAAGLALQHRRKISHQTPNIKDSAPGLPSPEDAVEPATHPELAGAYMAHAARSFSEQLERIAELLLVLVVGFMLTFTRPDAMAVAFVIYALVVVRPLAVWLGLRGATVLRDQRLMMSWFGIRGIGSIYYLMFSLGRGLPEPAADLIVTLTLTTVGVSIVVHGISVTPLMALYSRRKSQY